MGGDLNIHAFSAQLLVDNFGGLSPVHYLNDYLAHLKVATVVVEEHYVDRHFLDDFSDYYARSFAAPRPSCSRFHFFSDISADNVDGALASAYDDPEKLADVERVLQENYLGFVVRRPVPHAPVGRTVLKTYPADGGRRHYQVLRPYRVNVAGVRLTIDGLAFQQQDGGTAVCASTALWSSLQRVAYMAGYRTPTASAITRAAASPFPASNGLSTPQMATALAALGYAADGFGASTDRGAFRAKLVACLDSHLPVILLISQLQETGAGPDAGKVKHGHAIAVTGYSEPTKIVTVFGPTSKAPAVRMKTASTDVLYVHDDNIGSHAHYELLDSDERNELGHKILLLRRGRTGAAPVPWWNVSDWIVEGALVPKPVKMRMGVESAFQQIWLIRANAEKMFPGLDLHYSTRFATGVEYKRTVLESRSLDRTMMRAFQTLTSLPRHVGIVSVHDDVALLCDFVIDVSELNRRPIPPILAIVGHGVPLHSQAWINVRALAGALKCTFVTAKSTPLAVAP